MKTRYYLLAILILVLANTQLDGLIHLITTILICILLIPVVWRMDKEIIKKR